MMTIAKKMLPLPPKEAKSTVSVLERLQTNQGDQTHIAWKKIAWISTGTVKSSKDWFLEMESQGAFSENISYVEINEFTPEH